jgi:hypothetical protein
VFMGKNNPKTIIRSAIFGDHEVDLTELTLGEWGGQPFCSVHGTKLSGFTAV